MRKTYIVTESGGDLFRRDAEKYEIEIVPMHVQMGNETLDDGKFPPEEVCAYYDSTGKVPTTSASTPYDFEKIFDEKMSPLYNIEKEKK